MTVRTRYKITAAISSTTAEERDLGNVTWEIANDIQNEGGAWKSVLAAGSSDILLNMGNVATARFVLIRINAKDPTQTPNEVVIKLNSTGGEEITIKPLEGAAEGHFLIATDAVTALYASNPGATVMEVTVVASGD